jgi:hypothetical protein
LNGGTKPVEFPVGGDAGPVPVGSRTAALVAAVNIGIGRNLCTRLDPKEGAKDGEIPNGFCSFYMEVDSTGSIRLRFSFKMP